MQPWLYSLKRRLGPTTFSLMALMLGLHLVFLIGSGLFRSQLVAEVYANLALTVEGLAEFRLWSLVTYGLLHDLRDPFHLVFNLLMLFFLGPAAERQWGAMGLARFVALAVLGGGVLQSIADVVLGVSNFVVGFSAATMALLATFAWARPDAQVLLFFVMPIQARYIVPIVVALDALMALSGGGQAFFAHMGGLGVAWWMSKGWLSRRNRPGAGLWARWFARPRKTKSKNLHVIPGGRPNDRSTWN